MKIKSYPEVVVIINLAIINLEIINLEIINLATTNQHWQDLIS